MNRLLIAVSCFGLLACGEIVAINDAGPEADAPTGTAVDANLGPDATPPDPCLGPDIALTDLEGCFRRMQCKQMIRCMPGFESQEHCEDRIFDTFAKGGDNEGDDGPPSVHMFREFEKAVGDGVADYNGGKAFTCLKSVSEASCSREGGGGDEPACEEILTGNKNTNDECFEDFECQPGSYCRENIAPACTQECCAGTCQVGLNKGDLCTQPNKCKPHLDCVYVNAIESCEDGLLNSKCEFSGDCKPGFYCSNSNKCEPDWAPNAAACGSDYECPDSQLCVPDDALTKCGDVDVEGDPCRDHCWGNLFCNGNNQCQALPSAGDNCAALPSTQFPKCASIETRCQDTCVPRTAEGFGCQDNFGACEFGLFCSGEIPAPAPAPPAKCEVPRGEDAFCGADHHCASDYCWWDTGEASGQCQAAPICYVTPS